MEKMNDLKDLLKHEIEDLYSAEEQIIKALPAMIGKASDPTLKRSLENHLRITEEQKNRLDRIQEQLNGDTGKNENTGLWSRLMNRRHFCKGMKGIIEEGEKIMAEDMDPDVKDAAIIASCQKVEHYEICGYGTAKAFALELNLTEVARTLDQTLNEEYEADLLLTDLAVGRLNKEAETTTGPSQRTTSGTRTGGNGTKARGKVTSAEQELQMVSNKGSNKSSGRNTTGTTGRTSGTPQGESTRSGKSGSAASRTSGSQRSQASGTSANKGSGRSSSKDTRSSSAKGRNSGRRGR